jgi:ferritin-like metal-binding protein YciE
MNQEVLQECLIGQLRDIYDAEKQLTKALPKLAKAANSEDLTEALKDHLEETQNQVQRLEEVFQLLDMPAKGKACKGMKGLIEEGNEHVQEEEEGPLRDLMIIAAAQRVEHYEVSAYGTARTLAEQLGNTKAAKLLQETEDEEVAADSKLSDIAMMIYESEDEEIEEEEEESARPVARKTAASNQGRGASRMAR